MVADSLWGSTPMNTFVIEFRLRCRDFRDARRALLLRAGQSPLEPHLDTVLDGNADRI
jgi:hypothetical protein